MRGDSLDGASPFLSILITTYNRSSSLRECLESIEKSLDHSSYLDRIEIIVFNNGCTDNTAEILRSFEDILPLRVFQTEKNIGFINGLLKSIEPATGRYCWFLGDDDYIAIDNLNELVNFVEVTFPDILLVNHYSYIFENGKKKFLLKDNNKYLMKKSKTCYDDYREYILNARHPSAFFGHIAPVIFRRELWLGSFSKEAVEKHSRSYSSHVYVFLSILKNAKRICYFRKQTLALGFGMPTDIFEEAPRYYRFQMNAEFFPDMFRDVFQEGDLLWHYMDVMLRNIIVVLLLGSKVRCDFSFKFYVRLSRLLYRHYKSHSFFWYGIVPLIVIPRVFFVTLYKLFMR